MQKSFLIPNMLTNPGSTSRHLSKYPYIDVQRQSKCLNNEYDCIFQKHTSQPTVRTNQKGSVDLTWQVKHKNI